MMIIIAYYGEILSVWEVIIGALIGVLETFDVTSSLTDLLTTIFANLLVSFSA